MQTIRAALSAMPVLRWLPEYRFEWLRPDLVAGLTLAAYLLPAGIGDASLAGLPPEAGLYACLFSGLVFWGLCSSKHTVITVTSALSLLIGASVGELSGRRSGPPRRARGLRDAHDRVDRLRGLAGSRRQRDQLLLRNRSRRLQGRPGAVPGEHTAAEAVRVQAATHGDFWERSAYFVSHLGDTHQASLVDRRRRACWRWWPANCG